MSKLKFRQYRSINDFRIDVLDVLLEDEVRNNLQISIISDKTNVYTKGWFMGTVTDEHNKTVLIALCVKPFNMLLYVPINISNPCRNDAMSLFIKELQKTGYRPPGIFTDSELAELFLEKHMEGKRKPALCAKEKRTLILMRLDKLPQRCDSRGSCRVLTEEDLSFVPLWEQAFCEDCGVPAFPVEENKERIRTRIGRDIHYIWEDAVPVSQAVFGRETPNGAVVNWVYTPPLYRGRGYASAVVGALSESLIKRGKKFCCLFADAGNMSARRIYSKLGYRDVCEYMEITFA